VAASPACVNNTNSFLVKILQHETNAFYFVLEKQINGNVVYLKLDATGDYRRNGRLWLSASQILS
jgi:hypothetical protein